MYDGPLGRFCSRDPVGYETGCRYALCRFCSRDPIGYEASERSLFQYVGGQPTGCTDPSGLEDPLLYQSDYRSRPAPPFPRGGTFKSAEIPNVKEMAPILAPVFGWFANDKMDRIIEIGVEPGIPGGGSPPTGPTGGNAVFYSPPYARGALIGGGVQPPASLSS